MSGATLANGVLDVVGSRLSDSITIERRDDGNYRVAVWGQDDDSLFGEAGNDDFDPNDDESEVKDRTAADNGRNSFVPSGQFASGVNAILAQRSFT